MSRRRWPLFVIGASAGTATWSGWVGLGGLTGFGPVRPFPGISTLTINTAITLPVGVEAYAIYALSVATGGNVSARGRRFAWASSAGALLLGMLGQVSYHVMEAAGVTGAPWWITTIVSVVPVLTIGAASLLWHFAHEEDAVEAVDLGVIGLVGQLDGVPRAHPILPPLEPEGVCRGAESDPIVSESDLKGVDQADTPVAPEITRGVSPGYTPERSIAKVVALKRPPQRRTVTAPARESVDDDATLVQRIADAIAAGQLTQPLSGNVVRKFCGVGLKRADRLRSMINQLEG